MVGDDFFLRSFSIEGVAGVGGGSKEVKYDRVVWIAFRDVNIFLEVIGYRLRIFFR